MGLNHVNSTAAPPSVSITNPMVPLAVPQPGHALAPLSRPMSAALGQDLPAHSPGFFAPSPFGPSPSNWSNAGYQAVASNRQLFIGNVCAALIQPSVVLTYRDIVALSMPMARPQGFVSCCRPDSACRRGSGARWSLTGIRYRRVRQGIRCCSSSNHVQRIRL